MFRCFAAKYATQILLYGEAIPADSLVGNEALLPIIDVPLERGEPDFPERSALWSEVIQNVGKQIAHAGFCSESQLLEAAERYEAWVKTDLMRQTLTMRAVTGRVVY